MTQQMVGKYQLVGKLAEGGMAEVFLAKAAGPMGFEKTLVLKRIRPELAEEPAFIQMFLSEAKLAARLTHPHIAQIFDFGESGGTYFLAMEYIDGPSLRMLIKRAVAQGLALPPTVCARLIADACEGLAFAHDFAEPDTGAPLNLIHRDVSPDNILLSRQGSVKVVDFGIAKAAGQSHKTESGVVKGKLAYMPPEQLRAKALDRRVDVYALGVVLYELLTGQRPYASESEAGLMQAILYEQPIPAAQLRPDLPQLLRRILSKALAKEREQRYSDCHAFQADLEAFIVSAGKPVMTQQVAQLINRAITGTELPTFPAPASPAPTLASRPPANAPRAEPPFLKRRNSSPTNEVPTADLRVAQVAKEEVAGDPVPSLPRPSSSVPTAQHRPPPQPRPTPLPSSRDVEPPEQRSSLSLSAAKPRSPARWVSPLLGGLLLVMGGGVVSQKKGCWPEPQVAAHVAEPSSTPDAGPSDTTSQPSGDVAAPDAGVAVVSTPPAGTTPPGPVLLGSPATRTPRSNLKGIVELRVFPFAIVYVGDRLLGEAPGRPVELPEGRHTLRFVNVKLSKTVLREVDVKAGERTIVKVNLYKE